MKQDQFDEDRQLGPSEANPEKHINFPEAEQERSDKGATNKTTSTRQEQWQQEIEEGEREKNRPNKEPDSSLPMHNDDTLGVP